MPSSVVKWCSFRCSQYTPSAEPQVTGFLLKVQVPSVWSPIRNIPQIWISPATSGFRKLDGVCTRLVPRARSLKVFGAFPGLLSWAILGSPYGRRAAAGFFFRRSADGWRSGRNDDFGFSLHFRVLEATADPSSVAAATSSG